MFSPYGSNVVYDRNDTGGRELSSGGSQGLVCVTATKTIQLRRQIKRFLAHFLDQLALYFYHEGHEEHEEKTGKMSCLLS